MKIRINFPEFPSGTFPVDFLIIALSGVAFVWFYAYLGHL